MQTFIINGLLLVVIALSVGLLLYSKKSSTRCFKWLGSNIWCNILF